MNYKEILEEQIRELQQLQKAIPNGVLGYPSAEYAQKKIEMSEEIRKIIKHLEKRELEKLDV